MKKPIYLSLILLLSISCLAQLASASLAFQNIASSSSPPVDEKPTGFMVKPGDQLIYNSSWGYYYKWDIQSATPNSLTGTVSERSSLTANWNPYLINVNLGWFDPVGGRIQCHYGVYIIPLPLNVSSFIDDIAGGHLVLWPASSANYTWDGTRLQIWSTTDPTYYAELNYNSLGILTSFNETYEDGGVTYETSEVLLDYYQKIAPPPAVPTTIGIQTTVADISPSLSVNTTAPVEFNISSTTKAPAGVSLNNSLVFIDISVNDSAAVLFPVQLTFNYTDQLLLDLGITASNLKIYYLNLSNQWEIVPCTVDTDQKIIVAELSHFSTYALAASPEGDNADDTAVDDDTGSAPGFNTYLVIGISIVLLGTLVKSKK